jgi:uncharacterized protein (TIGR00730 family)
MANADSATAQAVVTVFGSSRARYPDEEYMAAWRLGKLLAERDWTLCNGGHDGTMEAAARGAKELGGKTIGVTFNLYRPANRNVWLDQEIVTETLLTRLEKLVTLGDAYVILRGGIGTLLEFVLVWNLVQAPEFAHKPVVVVGEDWRSVFESMREHLPMHEYERESIRLVANVEEAVSELDVRLAGRAHSSDRKKRQLPLT